MSGITYAAPGDLDTTFNPPHGFVTYDSGDDDAGWAVAIQSNGKIVIAGESFNGTDYDILILRYNPDGSPDNSFGTNGSITYDGGSGYDFSNGISILSNGKLVVVGDSYNGTDRDILVLQYNPDGSPDKGFGTNGVVTYDNGNYDWSCALAIQSDGKIVVGGWNHNGTDGDFLVLRFNPDGSPDNSFGTNGTVTYDSGNHDYGWAVANQSDGKIVVVGKTHPAQMDTDVLLLRYNPDGSLDNSFGTNGVVTFDNYQGSLDMGYSVAIQSDGKIVVAGHSDTGVTVSHQDILVLRFNPDGSLDNGFGTNGAFTYDSGNSDSGRAVAIRSNGKVVVVGNSRTYTDSDILVLQYNPDGSPDKGFGTNGVVTYSYDQGSWDWAMGVAIQSDEKIVVVGDSDINGGRIFDVLVMRLLGDGTGSAPQNLSKHYINYGKVDGNPDTPCFIATAAYGSAFSKEVKIFRQLRDRYLLTNEFGGALVSVYYKCSPPLADWIAKHPTIRKIVRIGLYPILELSRWCVKQNPEE